MQQKAKFGASQLTNTTPTWAKWIFRITLAITSAATIYLAATDLLPEKIKYEILLAMKALDALMYAFSKMFGIPPPEKEN